MENALNILLFAGFVFFGAMLPGAILTPAFSRRSKKIPGPEAMAAVALLSGFIFQLVLWAALRWAGFSYYAVSVAHAAVVSALAVFALRDKHGRAGCGVIMKSVFSAETAVFLAAAVVLAAYFTYDKVPLYYGDELFRMSLAWAAQKGIPAQNMLVYSGVMHYYYAAEFFAGSASSVTKIPLETIYFRFLLPLNWTLLFFGIRGILAQYNPGFKRYIPHAAFLLFLLAHPNMLTHFTFRQNTFALGLAVLAMSVLWTAIACEACFPLVVCCAAPALITLAKAPCGALCLFFFCLAAILGARSGLLEKKRAAAAVILGVAAWWLAYNALSGQGFQTGSLLKIAVVPGSLQELLPDYIANPGLLAVLPLELGFFGRILGAVLKTIENGLSVLVIGLVPMIAAMFWFYSVRKKKEDLLSGPSGITLISAAAVVLVGAFFYCFVHYTIANGSDRYWLFFSLWMLSAVAYPFALEEFAPWLSARHITLFALVPAIDLAASAAYKLGYSGRLFGMIPKTFQTGLAILVLGILPAAAAFFWRSYNRGRSSALPGSKEVTAVSALAVFVVGTVAFFFIHYKLIDGPHKELVYLATWILAISACPLLLIEMKPRTFIGRSAVFALVPFLVALSHVPKYSYWASELKHFNGEGWTQERARACDILNSGGQDGKLYVHNILNRRTSALGAMCRKRMYVSGGLTYCGVWEDPQLYSPAHREAADFFNGKMPAPCYWLKAHNIGHVFWDSSGAPFKFPEAVKRMKFLDKIYQGGNVSLYAVGPCGEERQ